MKALGLAEHGRDILAEKCSDEYRRFVCLAVDGWDAAADRDLIRAVNACSVRNNWPQGSKFKLADLKPDATELTKLGKQDEPESETKARMIARFSVLRLLNSMINDAVMPAGAHYNIMITLDDCIVLFCSRFGQVALHHAR